MTYTTEDILKAAELAEIPESMAKFLTSLLDDASFLVAHKQPKYAPISVTSLFLDICRVSGFTPEQMMSEDRTRRMVYTRHTFAAMAVEMFPDDNLSYIGAFMGKGHPMVVYYRNEVRKVKEKRTFCDRLKLKLSKLV